MLTAIVVMALLATCFLFTPQRAEASTETSYSCSAHCYGINDWSGPSHGAFSLIDVIQLHAGNGLMSNEVWVEYRDVDGIGSRWVEAGYGVKSTQNYEFWFWAYIDNSSQYLEYDSPGLKHGSLSDFGYPTAVTIWKISGTTNSWNASIYGHAGSWIPNGFTMTNFSPNNSPFA